jgi:uncharacterized membrane protein HdeD (DUF308 family)
VMAENGGNCKKVLGLWTLVFGVLCFELCALSFVVCASCLGVVIVGNRQSAKLQVQSSESKDQNPKT